MSGSSIFTPFLIVSILVMIGGICLLAMELWRITRLQKQLRQSGVPNFKQAWRTIAKRRAYRFMGAGCVLFLGDFLVHLAICKDGFDLIRSLPPPSPWMSAQQKRERQQDIQEYEDQLRQKQQENDLIRFPFAALWGTFWAIGYGKAWRRDHPKQKEERT